MRRLIMLVVGFAVVASYASVVVTERPGRHELRDGTGVMRGQFWTHDECKVAIPAPTTAAPEKWTCKAVTYLDAVGNCDDVPMPAPSTDTVIEEAPPPSSQPYCAAGETCTPVIDAPNPQERTLENGSIERTYTNVGTLVVSDDWETTTETKTGRVDYPTCWGPVSTALELPAP